MTREEYERLLQGAHDFRQNVIAERDAMREDLMTILGRITALKTIWALMPESIRNVIAKYTDRTP